MSALEARQPSDLWSRRITRVLTLFLRWFSAHWLIVFNLAAAVYVALPYLAPVLMDAGREGAAGVIYSVYRPLCHQLPERSFFLFGGRPEHDYHELSHLLGGIVPPRYVGSPEIGFKIAMCQRCVAIYGTILLAGLLFGTLRRQVSPVSIRGFLLMIVPMAVDGMGQLVGLWTSTWITRLITGALFGVACVWLAYPHLERGMCEVHQDVIRASKESE